MSRAGYRRIPARDDILIAALTLPLYMAAAGRYGLRIFLALTISILVGTATEMIAARIRNKGHRLVGLPAWILLPLVLPPVFPLWMLGASTLFAAIVGVVFFGGYGRHIVSPVALGWSFATLSYPQAFGFGWSLPFPGLATGFSRYAAAVLTIDHPIVFLQAQREVLLADILSGNVPQTPGMAVAGLTAGCGLVLLLLRAVDVKSSLLFLGTAAGLGIASHLVMPETFGDPVFMLTGNLLLAGLFIFPDRRICPRSAGARVTAAVLGGVIVFLIRSFSTFPCGVMFAVLFANVFSPIIDQGFLRSKYGKAAR
ncbi:MAG TPA: RnfABCDGE type electron transport complex subunit D [Candidatus Krumholzibacterium sp.]|nr:RnfABCDGE type electron transport complex subunit D [Candidatus Krumholzibacterium sp.]